MSEPISDNLKSMIHPVPPLPLDKPYPNIPGWCVIEMHSTEIAVDFEFHEWAERKQDAEHCLAYENDVNRQWYEAFIAGCGSEGCIEHCPIMHSTTPREFWPIGFTELIRAGLVAEPENPPTMDDLINLAKGKGRKADDKNSY